ncbi:MAG: NAD(P)/FAD-dependent oxidoreductase [Proteobacteria bacterium]|nr:NAD(P)/FAD-dependent oxidoreductase [Pseudomonadota bacterium]
MEKPSDVAVIGAGPNGLSLAAHLADRGVDFRIFGKAMETWDTRMPRGMLLKSDGFATSLYDPGGKLSYASYCAEHGIPYAPLGVPPPLDSFSAYGHAFQKKLVGGLEEKRVATLERDGDAYGLTFDDGSRCRSKAVVVAVGITYFAQMPEALAGLPRDLVSHSADHHDLGAFKGRRVAVIGAGSSATDVAGLLHREGAEVHLVCRDTLWFNGKMADPRPLKDRLRSPTTPIGPGWRSFLYANFPLLFHRLPADRRLRIVRSHLGPAPAYFAKEMVLGRAYTHLGLAPKSGRPKDGGIELELANKGGETRTLQVDHVICATGYKPKLSRVPFLSEGVLSRVEALEDMPVLTDTFESSLPGLYFIGALASNSFGPLVRFACGAAFTAPRLARHLA